MKLQPLSLDAASVHFLTITGNGRNGLVANTATSFVKGGGGGDAGFQDIMKHLCVKLSP